MGVGGVGGRVGKGKNELVSDTISFLPRGNGKHEWGGVVGTGGQRPTTN